MSLYTPASPPPSPHKPKSKPSHFIRTIFPGVTNPVGSDTHKMRWSGETSPSLSVSVEPVVGGAMPLGRSQVQGRGQAPSGAGGRVASMVKGFEAVTLSNSRPYSSIPTPPSNPHLSAPSPTFSTTSTSSSGSYHNSSPVVPASVFQQQQQMRRSVAASTASSGMNSIGEIAMSATDTLCDRMRTNEKENGRARPVQQESRKSGANVSASETMRVLMSPSMSLSSDLSERPSFVPSSAQGQKIPRSQHSSPSKPKQLRIPSGGAPSPPAKPSNKESQRPTTSLSTSIKASDRMISYEKSSVPTEVLAVSGSGSQANAQVTRARMIVVPEVANPLSQRVGVARGVPTQQRPATRSPTSTKFPSYLTYDYASSIPPTHPPLSSSPAKSCFQEDFPTTSDRFSGGTTEQFRERKHEQYSHLRIGLRDEREASPPRPIEKDVRARGPTGGRKRAVTLGNGDRQEAISIEYQQVREAQEHHQVIERMETQEEKERRIAKEFSELLDSMQLPSPTVRLKMQGVALSLKEEMLRSATSCSPTMSTLGSVGPTSFHPISDQHNRSRPSGHSRGYSLNVLSSSTHTSNSIKTNSSSSAHSQKRSKSPGRFLRRSKSTQSMTGGWEEEEVRGEIVVKKRSGGGGDSRGSGRGWSHGRTASASNLFRSLGKSAGDKDGDEVNVNRGSREKEDCLYWAVKIRSCQVKDWELKEVGRLRGMLRSESPSWVEDFIRSGGYLGLCERLKDLLDVEWREEQHDDQMLFEILRCFKALTLISCGKRAISSSCPTPFLPLTALLFSEKKPGDLPCRQVLVELLTSTYDLCPPNAVPVRKEQWKDVTISLDNSAGFSPIPFSHNNGTSEGSIPAAGVRRYTRKMKGGDEDAVDDFISEERRAQTHEFVLSLMKGPPNEKEEAKIDFIQEAHKPRIYKTWVTEITGVVCDYFWIFCHSTNMFWSFDLLNEEGIESPKVPSGMTGGVEYEAMAYCTSQFKLINAVAKHAASPVTAFQFHNALFDSGFERVLLTLRRASQSFYPTLHLEIARYLSLARSVRFNPGAHILSFMEEKVLRPEEKEVLRLAGVNRGGGPRLEEMRFD